MRMTDLALPKPGPPGVVGLAALASWRPSSWASEKPKTAEPPTRSSSRRVRPRSHVSLPGAPGITSMLHHLETGRREGRRAGGEYKPPTKLLTNARGGVNNFLGFGPGCRARPRAADSGAALLFGLLDRKS